MKFDSRWHHMFYSIGRNSCFCNFQNSQFYSLLNSQYRRFPFYMIASMRERPWSLLLFLILAMLSLRFL